MNARTLSTAVMQRRVEPADSLDFFPTPPWGTRALCEHVLPAVWPWPDLFGGTACDPACGEGHMAEVLREYFGDVGAVDVFDYGYGLTGDFLHPDWHRDWLARHDAAPDWIVSNPPFNLATEFVLQGLRVARRGVAMLVRSAFNEGQERYRDLFRDRPPCAEAVFVERLAMHKGRWVTNGKSATSYCWFVWLKHVPHDWQHSRRLWIPPCKRALTRHDDWLRFSGCMDLPKTHPALAGAAPRLREAA